MNCTHDKRTIIILKKAFVFRQSCFPSDAHNRLHVAAHLNELAAVQNEHNVCNLLLARDEQQARNQRALAIFCVHSSTQIHIYICIYVYHETHFHTETLSATILCLANFFSLGHARISYTFKRMKRTFQYVSKHLKVNAESRACDEHRARRLYE